MPGEIRQKRFRRILLTETELKSQPHIDVLHPLMDELHKTWITRALSDAEVAARYILNFLRAFRPRDYLGGPHNENLNEITHSSASAQLSAGVQVFARHSLRSVPLAVNRSIVAWANGRYPLRLLDFVPSAEQLLEWQTKGERVVTCLFRADELTNYVNGARDPLGFVLHDLIHAEHFFRDKERFAGQVKFYREVRSRLAGGDFVRVLSDLSAREKFEYIIADMNSHPEHLRGCLAQLERSVNGST